MKIKRFLITGLLALGPAVFAQEPAEMTSRDAPVVFRSRVNLVQVPVVVRDAQGRAVGNLRKEDFRLADKGKPQEITQFSVETHGKEAGARPKAGAVEQAASATAPAASSAPPDRFIVFLFDDRNLETEDLLRARAAAKRRLAAAMGPGVRAALFTSTGRGEVDFTEDIQAIQQAMDAIMPRVNGGSAFNCDETSHYIGDNFLNRNNPQAKELLVLQVASCYPYMNGEGVVAMARTMALRAVAAGRVDSSMALNALDRAIARLAVMPGDRRLVFVSSGFLAWDLRREEDVVIDRAVRSKVAFGALDARGLFVSMSEPRPPTSMSPAVFAKYAELRISLDTAAATAQGDVLAELANGTGGIAFQNNNDLETGFDRLTEQAEFVYVLAFSPQNLKHDGDFHSLKVAVNGRGYTVSARRGYYAPTQLADAAEQAKEEIREAVFSRDEMRDVPIELRTQFFKPDEDTARLTTIARVDLKALRFRQAEERNWDDLTIVTALFDRNGNYVAGFTKDVSMRLKQPTFERMMNSGLSLRNTFNIIPGVYQVRLVVRDSENQVMAAQNIAVEIP
jgi:VWFA-related protein